MRRGGFTLIELLAVIVVIGILVALVSPAIRNARTEARKAQAKVEMQSIETAVKAYYDAYGKLPAPADAVQGGGDIVFSFRDADSATSRAIVAILTMDEGTAPADNPRKMVFLDRQSATSTKPGKFRDPWGVQYLVALDTDYDGKIEIEGRTIHRKVAVAAAGLYQRHGCVDTNDLVLGWQ